MKRNLLLLLFLVSLFLVVGGALFKMMHWPFADVMQLTGMLAGLIGVGALIMKIWSKPTA